MARVALVVGSDTVAVHHIDEGSEAEVTFTATPPVAAELAAGTLDPNVAFMQGRLKTAGDLGAVLRVLPRLAASSWPA